MFVPTRPLLTGLLSFISVTQAGAGETQLFQAKMGLIKAPFVPSLDLLLVGITEADFDGYARSVLAPYSLVFEGEGVLLLISGTVKHWQPTGNVTPNTIYGWFMADTTGAILLGTELFDAPIALAGAAFGFDHTPRFGFDPNGNWGLAVVG